MPITRKKACRQCRQAKARCSLALPRCSRCGEQNLRCEYHKGLSAHVQLRTSSSSANTPAPTVSNCGYLSSAQHSMQTPGPCRSGWGPDLSAHTGSDLLLQFDPGLLLPPSSDMLGDLTGRVQPGTVHPPGEGLLGTPQSSGENDNSGLTPWPPRRNVTTQSILTTRILLGQLALYPKMLIEGKTLPPFIHGQCSLSDSLADSCSQDDNHQCLPETLAICASLVRMFFHRTPGNRAFVWEAIYREHARLRRQIKDQHVEASLGTAQAVCIYLLLQALDREIIAQNDIESVARDLANLASRFYNHEDYAVEQRGL
ncbi:Zn(2)-C6 fungal-type domain-containing protein [Fusarium sp. Ph1]|nr:Zn(2)-C6 fungal-type domain-containing protein [Fusarium sp. Ph1]